MKKAILVSAEEEREIIARRVKRSINENLWNLTEKTKMGNLNPNKIEVGLKERNKIQVYYFGSYRHYEFTEKDMQENFSSLSERIFNDILSKFKTISMYITDKKGTRKLRVSYAFDTEYKISAVLNDYTEDKIASAIRRGAKKIEIIDYFSQKALLELKVDLFGFDEEDLDEEE